VNLRIDVEASDGAARTGRITTSRGSFRTPCFMPVGTRGAVRTLSSADLEALGAEVVLGNTYHLMLRPGVDVVAKLGGLHGFMGWSGHVLTDSGGYQVFSLEPKVDDDGVTFRSTYDGDTHRLTPEGAVELQVALGADIAMVLDECPPWPAEPGVVEAAVTRTAAWAGRARAAQDALGPETQSLFGIVQGGVDADLRRRSAEETVAVGFDGYGIGGFSVGEPRDLMLPALAATTEALPVDRPRYLMGVGDPMGLVEAIATGVDLFDCVLPTRFGRHGTILTAAGRYNLRKAANAADDTPLDPECACSVCARWSRGYLRHLLMVDEPTAPRLLTLHNVAWTFALVERARAAIETASLASLRSDIRAVWG
jgi:queuine tRNA-ribosyltransferase